jgi:FAD/FMN-containing dehydrogenase
MTARDPLDTNVHLLGALRDALPARAILADGDALEDHAFDALGARRGFIEEHARAVAPIAVVLPETTEQVAAVVRLAAQHRTPVVPYGGGTGLMGGARSVRPDVVLDLKRMARIRELDADAGWAWIEAGAVLGDVNRALEPQGLMLGHDPWTVDIATIGGTISTNGLGYLGGKYGSMGQQVLALEVVLPDGRVLATRPAQPHSTGIDLPRLFVGGEGTNGIITAPAVRVFPIPEASVRLGFRFESFEGGFDAILAMRRIGLVPAMLDYGERSARRAGWEPQPPTLYLGLMGMREEVEGQVRRAEAICSGAEHIDAAEVEEFWAERHVPAERFAQRRRRDDGRPPAGQCFDYVHVALPASGVLAYRERATALARAEDVDVVETGLWVHAGLFSMVLATSGEDGPARMSRAVDAALRLAIESGGSIEYCHGVGVRLAHLMREEHGAGLDVMRELKRTLDPHHILNPGKLALEEG